MICKDEIMLEFEFHFCPHQLKYLYERRQNERYHLVFGMVF
jgi:hypothetical protein